MATEMAAKSLLEALAEVPDPRSKHGLRYKIASVLAVAVCAMACGARSQYAIAQWGKEHFSLVKETLGITRKRAPSQVTFHRVFRRLDGKAFEKVLGQWFQARGLRKGDAIALDGKKLRGIHGEEVPGVDLVSAYAHRRGIVLDQEPAPGEGQELAAVREILKRLDLEGKIVTGDAQLAQRDICQTVGEKGGTICSA